MLKLLLLAIVGFCVAAKCPSNLHVKAKHGVFIGQYKENYIAFEGIPYAQPPVNELRFEPTVARTKTPNVETVLRSVGSPCPSWNVLTKTPAGSEDCLFLNIYKPKMNQTKLLPVIFHIHGGAFLYGKGDMYNEKFLMQSQKVIFVNFNYRLGVFGFIASGDGRISGNMGFKDQAMALKWVRENIDAFGGDPEKITITGSSAGAASIHLFYMSPLTRGNFAAGISNSGVAIAPWVLTRNVSGKYAAVVDGVGCPRDDKAVDCLKAQPFEKLIKVIVDLIKLMKFETVLLGLTIEAESTHAFMTKDPLELLKKGEIDRKPWLTTIVQDEGLIMSAPWVLKAGFVDSIDENWNEEAPFMFYYDAEVERRPFSQKIRNFYKKSDKLTLKEMTDALTDCYFRHPLALAVKYQAPIAPTYVYEFRFKGVIGLGELMSAGKHLGVAHGDDAEYIFSVPYRMRVPFTQAEKEIGRILINMYETMASTGIPEGPSHKFPQTALGAQGNINGLQINSPKDIETFSAPYAKYGSGSLWDELTPTN